MTSGIYNRTMSALGLGEYSPRGLQRKRLEAEVHAARTRFFEVGRDVRRQSSALTLTNLKTAGYANSVAHAVEGVAKALDARRQREGDEQQRD